MKPDTRRAVLATLAALPAFGLATTPPPERRWYDAAVAMRDLARTWGDQDYGAVVVLDGKLVGEGPSRVVLHGDPSAHSEREAIRDAQRRLKRQSLEGAVMYSTSAPCAMCREAAAAARITRLIHGPRLEESGAR